MKSRSIRIVQPRRLRGSTPLSRARVRPWRKETIAYCHCRGAAGYRAARACSSSLLTEAGLFNAADELGVAFGGFASLEAIVNLKPDFLLISEAGDHAEDEGQAFLLHPALERFYPPSKRIVVPDRLTVCGGVMLAEALDVLVGELARVER